MTASSNVQGPSRKQKEQMKCTDVPDIKDQKRDFKYRNCFVFINVFTFNFDQLNSSLLNKRFNFFQKKKE